MNRTTTRGRPPVTAWLAVAACLAATSAHAGATAHIDVTALQVSVTAIAPGRTPAVSFTGAGGSTSACEATSGRPATDHSALAQGAAAFGAVASALSSDPAAGGMATLAGDVFGDGAVVHAAAYANGPGVGATSQGTVGLANDVAAATFTLAPGTRMTITADVQAFASVSGASTGEMADAGLLMTLTDADGGGPQFARVSFDAIALGLFGPWDDREATFVSLVYENDTDADITGLFSGYVASYASAGDPSAVPEPGAPAMMLAGLALAGVAAASRARGRGRPRTAPQQ